MARVARRNQGIGQELVCGVTDARILLKIEGEQGVGPVAVCRLRGCLKLLPVPVTTQHGHSSFVSVRANHERDIPLGTALKDSFDIVGHEGPINGDVHRQRCPTLSYKLGRGYRP